MEKFNHKEVVENPVVINRHSEIVSYLDIEKMEFPKLLSILEGRGSKYRRGISEIEEICQNQAIKNCYLRGKTFYISFREAIIEEYMIDEITLPSTLELDHIEIPDPHIIKLSNGSKVNCNNCLAFDIGPSYLDVLTLKGTLLQYTSISEKDRTELKKNLLIANAKEVEGLAYDEIQKILEDQGLIRRVRK